MEEALLVIRESPRADNTAFTLAIPVATKGVAALVPETWNHGKVVLVHVVEPPGGVHDWETLPLATRPAGIFAAVNVN
jgi:hypothetical protein